MFSERIGIGGTCAPRRLAKTRLCTLNEEERLAAVTAMPEAIERARLVTLQRPLQETGRSARLAGAERDITSDAKQARADRVVREFHNRYDLWRA